MGRFIPAIVPVVSVLIAACGKGKEGTSRTEPSARSRSVWTARDESLRLTMDADSADGRVLVHLKVENRSDRSIELSPAQREMLCRLEVVFRRHAAAVRCPLKPPAAIPDGLGPGAVLEYSAAVRVERLALYAAPPANGGAKIERFHVEGPQLPPVDPAWAAGDPERAARLRALHEAYLGLLTNGRIEIRVPVRFPEGDWSRAAWIDLYFVEGAPPGKIEALLRRHGLTVERTLPTYRVRVPPGGDRDALLKALREEPLVASAEPG